MSSSPLHLLILRAGHTHPEVARRHGDYDRWFVERMDGLGCRFTVHDVPEAGLPDTSPFQGVIVTGTSASVLDGEEWMSGLGRFLVGDGGARSATRPPVLAVCFAAQLCAAAAGGRVVRHPQGWEIGTVGVHLTETGRTDPLFAGFDAEFEVQATHQDEIAALPAGAERLAGNEHSAVQAFSLGEELRAVQFHPEASVGIIGTLIELRRDGLEEEKRRLRHLDRAAAREAVTRLRTSAQDTPWGRRILDNWVTQFVRRAP